MKGGSAVSPQATVQRLVVIGHARSRNGWSVSTVGRASSIRVLSGALMYLFVSVSTIRPQTVHDAQYEELLWKILQQLRRASQTEMASSEDTASFWQGRTQVHTAEISKMPNGTP